MPEITDAELEEFNKYKQLGTVDDVTTNIGRLSTLERESVINEAAQIAGFKPSVLSRIAADVTIEVKDGKAVVGDTDLGDYAQEHWEDFLPSLKATESQTKQAVPFVRQPSKTANEVNQSKAVVTNFLKQTYAAPKQVN